VGAVVAVVVAVVVAGEVALVVGGYTPEGAGGIIPAVVAGGVAAVGVRSRRVVVILLFRGNVVCFIICLLVNVCVIAFLDLGGLFGVFAIFFD
jgi:hypothetical protein